MDTDKNIPYIPYIALESAQVRNERIIKRLIVAIIIVVILFFISNLAWLYAWNQYDYSGKETTTSEVTVDGKEGTANYIGNDGDIVNGEDNSEKNHD